MRSRRREVGGRVVESVERWEDASRGISVSVVEDDCRRWRGESLAAESEPLGIIGG